MELESDQLKIKALSLHEMKLYLLEDFALENALHVNHGNRTIATRVKTVIENNILPKLNQESENALYYTFWTVIDKASNCMVADICFKGKPNENGEIEIGYGTYPHFQGKGFMSNAVKMLLEWAFTQTDVKAVIASTSPENIASHKVLEKNNFIVSARTEDNIFWRLEKPLYS